MKQFQQRVMRSNYLYLQLILRQLSCLFNRLPDDILHTNISIIKSRKDFVLIIITSWWEIKRRLCRNILGR